MDSLSYIHSVPSSTYIWEFCGSSTAAESLFLFLKISPLFYRTESSLVSLIIDRAHPNKLECILELEKMVAMLVKRRVPASNGQFRVGDFVLMAILMSCVMSAANAQDATAPSAAGDLPEPNEGNPCSIGWFQAHGWLMWLAFGVFIPLGVFASRYGQYYFSQWFLAHISVQVVGVILSTTAFAIAATKFPVSPWDSTHVKLGLAIMVLVWLQPLMAVIRPQRGAAVRPAWFTVHWLFGTAAVILAWFNIFKGLDLYMESWPVGGERKAAHVVWGVQLAILAFLFLLLDRLPYIKAQGKVPGAIANVNKSGVVDNPHVKTDSIGTDGRPAQWPQV